MTHASPPDPWTAEFDVSAALAQRLIAEQFPQVASASILPLGEGWDNAAFLVGGAHVFRFPRRTVAAALMATERAVLPLLVPALPLAAPVPSLLGEPTPAYPWPFTGYRFLPGRPLSSLRLDNAAYQDLAAGLGAFLRALHAMDGSPALAAGLPGDELGRLDRARTLPKLRARLDELRAAGFARETSLADAYLDGAASRETASVARCIVHGDLYARHVLVSDNGRPCGVIDWGDVHFGDPAVDLAIAFSLMPPEARGPFFAAYGEADGRTLELARYRAVYHSALVAHYGRRIGDGDLLDAGLRGLRQGCAAGDGVGP